MDMSFKPMLAATLLPSDIVCDDNTVYAAMKQLRYPVLATTKKDGIRALRMKMPYLASRTLKWIPNEELCARALSLPIGYDMELWSPKMDYSEIQSVVMSEKGDASKIEFHILDDFSSNKQYSQRIGLCIRHFKFGVIRDSVVEEPLEHSNAKELFEFEQSRIELHSEGICFRTPDSPYKHGRSTLQEQYLVKHCRWIYEECVIVGFKEQCENLNEKKHNAVGKMDRSKSIEGMIGKNTLGAFKVKNIHGVVFDVGTGQSLTDEIRKEFWERPENFPQTVVIKSKAHGVKNKPRSPIFWGFRGKGY